MSGVSNPAFDRYIGIDYSGAKTPTSSLKGLRIYMADRVIAAYRGATAPESAQILDADAASPNGWSRGFRKTSRHWSALTTASRFRCSILRPTTCRPIGRHSSTTSSTIGRPTGTSSMWISSAMASWATVRPVRATRAGGG